MNAGNLIINGHFRNQQVTGVQRYAREVISQFNSQGVAYGWIDPPRKLDSDILRQLWMQAVMPHKIPDDVTLWSPTNIGPISHKNQVITLHDIADQLHPEWFNKKYVRWRQLILPQLLRNVSRILTVSEFSRDTITEQYPVTKDKIHVVYNGIRHNHFYPRGEEKKQAVKKQLNLQNPFVLSVGSLDSRKNIPRLVKTWNQLPTQIQQKMDLVIVGRVDPKFNFEIDKNSSKKVRFLGYIDDQTLPVLYSMADIFIYPSLFEGFGLPVLEAMACGAPVITSNTTALEEVSGPAMTINPYSGEEMRNAILSLIRTPGRRKEMSGAGIEWAGSFTWEKTAEETLHVLKQAT